MKRKIDGKAFSSFIFLSAYNISRILRNNIVDLANSIKNKKKERKKTTKNKLNSKAEYIKSRSGKRRKENKQIFQFRKYEKKEEDNKKY